MNGAASDRSEIVSRSIVGCPGVNADGSERLATNWTLAQLCRARVRHPLTANARRGQPRSGRRFVCPQGRSLQEHNPDLFVALDLANAKSLSDKELFSALPRVIR